MRLTSPAFEDGATLPKKYTEDGQNISPPLKWTQVPPGTREFALIADDPDAPREHPWVHWVLYGIPGEARELREAVPRRETLDDPPGAMHGLNSWPQNNVGYRGPAPPKGHGTHHYHFHLYALSRPLALSSGLSKDALLRAIEDRILGEADLMATYERAGSPQQARA
jgi:Raf kinase inhibitor-like YbhB/YbcL family protein